MMFLACLIGFLGGLVVHKYITNPLCEKYIDPIIDWWVMRD